MLKIIKEGKQKLSRYSIKIGPLYEIEPYHTYISSDTSNVRVWLRIADNNSVKDVCIPGGRSVVEILESTVSIYTEEPVTVAHNTSGSKEEPLKK